MKDLEKDGEITLGFNVALLLGIRRALLWYRRFQSQHWLKPPTLTVILSVEKQSGSWPTSPPSN